MKKIKKVLLFLLYITGINILFSFLNRNKILILWYHGICDDDFNLLHGYDERHIPKTLFRKQLAYLRKKGYSFITMSELAKIISGRKKSGKMAVLTFDDGFKNVIENAYPIMKEFGAKGCFYLVSDLIGGKDMLWSDYVETVIRNIKQNEFKFMYQGNRITYPLATKQFRERAMKDIKDKLRSIPDEERQEHMKQFTDIHIEKIPKEFLLADCKSIKTLDRDILEVGSHTRTHPDCKRITSYDKLKDEVEHSKIEIERSVGYKVEHFCYPAGAYDDTVLKAVEDAGYKTAVTVTIGNNDIRADLYALKRISVEEDFLLFKANISGSYLLIKNVKDKLLKNS